MSLVHGLEEGNQKLIQLPRADSWISQGVKKPGREGSTCRLLRILDRGRGPGAEPVVPGTRGCTWCPAWCPRRNTAWHCRAARRWSRRRRRVPERAAAAARAAGSPNGPRRPPSGGQNPAAASRGGGGGLHTAGETRSRVCADSPRRRPQPESLRASVRLGMRSQPRGASGGAERPGPGAESHLRSRY